MAKLSHTDSKRMYSWWWDSHISPKNSKWLQENLTDMDAKVKGMIKLIEEDADSFARRAEMYYKKRPELMKMVEEFYRAYRALAERYDHATGVIRHAHRTMSEAFPNQVPPIFSDDSPASSGSRTDPRTPEMMTQVGESPDEFDSITSRKGMKPLNNPFGPVERARRGLNFDEVEEKEKGTHNHENVQVKEQIFSKSCEETEDIQALKEAITKLEAEKEAGRVQYEQSLDKLSQLQAEISKMNEDCQVLNERASKAENEVVVLKESLAMLEAEKESKLQDYQQCVGKISSLQTVITTAQEDAQKLNERASSAETEVQSLKDELDKLTVEKDAALDKYMQSLETISNLENKLLLTEEDARRFKERAEKAESEVEFLKQTVAKLTEEKESTALQHQQCLETISILEAKLLSAQEEAKCLTVEVDDGATKLKGAEEQCLLLERSNQSLHSELESLMLKVGTQTQELTEKQKELGRLWACIQEERLRFVEAETAFQTLQHLHAQTQEELRSVASEMRSSAQLLKVMETQNNSLQDEVLKVKQENTHLNEINASSTLSIKDLQNEISCLMESKGKLQEEVELRVDQRNALQQEIYCLKEELNDLNKKHHGILDQVHAVGLNPESLESSVKELEDDNSNLKDAFQRESTEKAALLVKLEQLLEKNSLLETSLSDLNAELEAVRGKVEALEQSCQSLLKEKSTLLDEKASLMMQLHETKMILEKVTENNTVLESSIADAHHQLETLKPKSKILEDSCQLLASEKAGLASANDDLSSQLESTNLMLEDLGKLYGELEGRCMTLEKENASNHCKIEELHTSLGVERQEHVNYVRISEARLGDAETEMSLLKEECQQGKRELDQLLDNAMVNEIEIFVLRTAATEMKEYDCLLSMKNQKLLDKVSLSEKKILLLKQNNFEQQNEIKSLSGQTGRLRAGTGKLLKVLNIVHDHRLEDRLEQDGLYFNQLFSKLQDMQNSLHKAEAENLVSNVEVSILIAWLSQLNLDLQSLKVDKNKIHQDLRIKTEQALLLQNQVLALNEVNEELRSKLREGDCYKEALETQIEGLSRKLLDLQATLMEISLEKGSLMENILHLEEKNGTLEEENHMLCDKVLDLENLSLIFKSFADEKLVVLRDLGDDRDKLQSMNAALMRKLSLTEGSLDESKIENLDLKEKLLKTEDESKVIATAKNQLASEIENGKKLVAEMALELQMAEEKISLAETEKIVLSESVEDMRIKCNSAEGRLEESKIENHDLKEKLLKTEDELKVIATAKDQLASDIENGKKLVAEMALELQSAEEKISLVEIAKIVLSESVEDMKIKCNSTEGSLEESKVESHDLKEKLLKTEDELKVIATAKDQLASEIENVKKLVAGMALELQTAEEKISLAVIEKIVLSESVQDMIIKCNEANSARDEQENQTLKLSADNEHLSRDGNVLREACQKLEIELQELNNEHDNRRIQEEKLHLELKKQLNEIENGKKLVAGMALELQTAEEKISVVENEQTVLSETVEDMRIKYNEVKLACDEKQNQIYKLSAENENLGRDGNVLRETCQKLEVELQELKNEHENRRIQEENLHVELQKKLNEINELETQAVSVFSQLQYSTVSQLLYEQKFHELHEECLEYMDQNEDLKTQLAAYGPEIVSLKECISSLENQTDIHIKFQNPENEVADVSNNAGDSVPLSQEKAALKPSMFSDLHCLRVRLQAITKAAAEMKELLVQENISLHDKLDATIRQLELLQSDSERHRRSTRTTSEITEADNALLTKDIVLDQISANSSYRFSKREPVDADNQIVELWETGDPDGTVGLTVSKSKKVISPPSTSKADARRVNSMKKLKGGVPTSDSLIEEEFSVDKLEISKRFTDHHLEGNKRKILERLDSDVQKLANLQITVQDLKRKLEITGKGKRGKAVIECEALKGQLEEADTAIIKLFDLNSRLMKSIDKRSFSGTNSSSLDQEEEDGSTQRNKISEQARRMSEKIGRLQLEVQKLQFVLLKLDDEKEEKSRLAEARRRILLRDYLYGGGRTGNRRKKGHFCSCVQPSTVED